MQKNIYQHGMNLIIGYPRFYPSYEIRDEVKLRIIFRSWGMTLEHYCWCLYVKINSNFYFFNDVYMICSIQETNYPKIYFYEELLILFNILDDNTQYYFLPMKVIRFYKTYHFVNSNFLFC